MNIKISGPKRDLRESRLQGALQDLMFIDRPRLFILWFAKRSHLSTTLTPYFKQAPQNVETKRVSVIKIMLYIYKYVVLDLRHPHRPSLNTSRHWPTIYPGAALDRPVEAGNKEVKNKNI